jgi:hypothetical protein
MATKSMSYDAPAYQAVLPLGFNLTGNAGATAKFAAFTDTLVKSVTVKATTAGTSADVVTMYKYSGTATSTQVLTTIGSGVVTGTNVVSTFTLAQGDAIGIVKGTDATAVYAVGVELGLVPRADVTA